MFITAPSFVKPLMFAFISAALCAIGQVSKAEAFSFALEPDPISMQHQATWRAVLALLANDADLQLEPVIPSTLADFEASLRIAQYDFALMNPYFYSQVGKPAGYLAFASRRAQPLRGLVLSKKVGGVNDVTQLNGKTIAFPHPKRFGSSIVPQINLATQEVKFERRFFNSLDAAFDATLLGKTHAVASSKRLLDSASPEVQTGLKIIWQSPSYTPAAIAAHARVPQWKILKLKRALITLSRSQDETILNHFSQLQVVNGFQSAKDSDWDDARAINYKSLNKHIRE